MNKYDVYYRDKEKMVMVSEHEAVNLQSALALGLVARDDIHDETKRAPRAKREPESLSQYISNKELDGEKV